jgi:hypothetical protein
MQEKAEVLRIQKALAPIGYFVYGVTTVMGTGSFEIHARLYKPGQDEALIKREEEILARLPDNAGREDYEKSLEEIRS